MFDDGVQGCSNNNYLPPCLPEPEAEAEQPVQPLDEASNPNFAEEARGTEPNPELDSELAALSKDVYTVGGDPTVDTGRWSAVEPSELRANGVTAPLENTLTGFQAKVYTDGEGRYVVAFAGTDDPMDWASNARQGLGLGSIQYEYARNLAKQMAVAFDGNVVVTGHSLGGGLASAAALDAGVPAVTFNAAGLHENTLTELGFRGKREEIADSGQIRQYSVTNDILTTAQKAGSEAQNIFTSIIPGGQFINKLTGDVFLPEAVGTPLQLKSSTNNPLTAHGMDEVLKGLESPAIIPDTRSLSEKTTDFLVDGTKWLGGKIGDGARAIGSGVTNAASTVWNHPWNPFS